MKKLKELPSIRAGLKLLGNDREIGEMVQADPKAVNNWRNNNWLPSRVAFRIQWELNRRGRYLKAELLGQSGCGDLGIKRLCK